MNGVPALTHDRKGRAIVATEETHKATKELGPSVVDGRLLWTSASGITRADHNSAGGCLRKWWYESVGGRRQPSTAAQKRGTALHEENEEFLIQGRPFRSQLALAGRWMVPDPSPAIMVEASLTVVEDGVLRGAWLQTAGIVIAGHVDVWNHSGRYVDPHGEVVVDAPNTLETKDWKTTRDFVWCKSPRDLADNVQMTTYAEAGFRRWPSYERARLTHGYYLTQGRPDARLSTALLDRDQVARKWEYSEGVVRRMVDAAREKQPSGVEGNRHACSAFGGCPHRTICSVGNHNSLDELFGDGSAPPLESLIGARAAVDIVARFIATQQGDPEDMSLKDKLLVDTSTIAGPAGVVTTITVDAEVAALQAAEAQRAAARNAIQIPAGLEAAVQSIDSSGRGMPMLTGRAAACVARIRGIAFDGHGLAGSGWLGDHPNLKGGVEDPAVLIALSGEVAKMPRVEPVAPPASLLGGPPPAAPAPVASLVAPPIVAPIAAVAPVAQQQATPPPVIAVVPPDAPASNPLLAAQPVPGLDTPKSRELDQLTTIPGLVESAAQATVPSLIGASTVATAAPADLDRAAGVAATPGTILDRSGEVAETKPKAGPGRGHKKGSPTTKADGIYLYVDCVPSVPSESFQPYVDGLCSAIASQFGAADPRTGDKDSPLGFNKWRGVVAALAAANPPAPGHYRIDTRGNEIAECVAIALEGACSATGGLFVRGTR